MTSYIYEKFFNPGEQIKSLDDLVNHYNNLRLNSSIFSKIFKYSMAAMLLVSPFIFKNKKNAFVLVPLMFSQLASINLLEYNTKKLIEMPLKIQNVESLTSEEINELAHKLSEIDKIWEN
jgi:hypothetical protein